MSKREPRGNINKEKVGGERERGDRIGLENTYREQVDDLVGDRVDPHDGHGEPEVGEDLEEQEEHFRSALEEWPSVFLLSELGSLPSRTWAHAASQ